VIVSLEPQLLARLSTVKGDGNADTAQALDAELATAVRRAALTRRVYYAAVLAVALYGTATGAVTRFGLPWPVAIGGIFALELGGVVFLSNAETRRRLGEPARLSRLLGTAVAGAAATFNLLTHPNALLGGFFALMSVLGFLAWWLEVENKRRDRMRARGQLAPATPSYELWDHWLRHPVLTRRARGFARAYPQLGLYGSLEAAVITMRRGRRNAALADALHRRIRAAVSKDMADIAVLTYDMDEVARRLRDRADYDGLTALLGSELTAERVLHGCDDRAALAARAWLTRDHVPDANSGSRLDHSEPKQLPGGVPGRNDTASAEGIGDARDAETAPPTMSMAMARLGRPTARRERPSPPIGNDPRPVQLRVKGKPAVLDTEGSPVRGLRTKSLELLVYLALHRDGAPQGQILEAIWPDVPPERATQRLSTCLANVRSIIRQVREAGDTQCGDSEKTDAPEDPVITNGGHYRLNPGLLTVDWWRTVDGSAKASTIDEHALRWDEIDESLGDLARTNDYLWIAAAREKERSDLARRIRRLPTT
jgi:hypothetical protein